MTFDENETVLKAQSGDRDAENEMIQLYCPLVIKIARSFYVATEEDREDLVQAGMIGLMNAVRKFDVEKGATFKTFASTCIRNEILTAIHKNSRLETLPIGDIEDASDGTDVVRDYEEKEMADLLLRTFRDVLNEREYSVLRLYLTAHTYQEISDILGITKKQVDNSIYSLRKKIKDLLPASDFVK